VLPRVTTNRANCWMNEPVVILGSGGHARVVLDVLQCMGRTVAGVLTPEQPVGAEWDGVLVLGDDAWLASAQAAGYAYAVGIGAVPGRMGLRQAMCARLRQLGLPVPALVHPSAVVSRGAAVADGVQVMAGAIVQPGVSLGMHALINTGARIDHDTVIGEGAHVAPSAVLCGDVRVGAGAFVGAGAVVLPRVVIGDGAEVAAGATVTCDVPPRHRCIPGHPFKRLGDPT